MAAPLAPPRLLRAAIAPSRWNSAATSTMWANQRVLALDQMMAREPIAGVTETVPTYRSLLVHYDPAQIGFEPLSAKLAALGQLPIPRSPGRGAGAFRWPMAGEHGVDLEDVAKALHATPDEIVARHIAGDYRVAMIGFTPGWSYLSGARALAAYIAAAESEIADACRHDRDRRHADGHPVPRRPERLASVGRTPVRTYQLHRDPTSCSNRATP